jgi:hypothetical protein
MLKKLETCHFAMSENHNGDQPPTKSDERAFGNWSGARAGCGRKKKPKIRPTEVQLSTPFV